MLLFQIALTFNFVSECGWRGFFGLEGTLENLCTRILKHGKSIMNRIPKMIGEAASHPNNCKSLINKIF